jgi:hypothetical protein
LHYFKPISADDTCPLASGWESMSLPDSYPLTSGFLKALPLVVRLFFALF